MEQEAIPINFESMFNFTGVSKSWLYKQPAVKELIKKAKGKSNNLFIQDQAVQLSTKDREIDILTKQIKQLRQQIDELRLQLEVSYATIYKQGS